MLDYFCDSSAETLRQGREKEAEKGGTILQVVR